MAFSCDHDTISSSLDEGLTLCPLFPILSIPIPEESLRVAQATFPRPSRFMQMRDRLGTIYDDAAFGALYPSQKKWNLFFTGL